MQEKARELKEKGSEIYISEIPKPCAGRHFVVPLVSGTTYQRRGGAGRASIGAGDDATTSAWCGRATGLRHVPLPSANGGLPQKGAMRSFGRSFWMEAIGAGRGSPRPVRFSPSAPQLIRWLPEPVNLRGSIIDPTPCVARGCAGPFGGSAPRSERSGSVQILGTRVVPRGRRRLPLPGERSHSLAPPGG